MRSVAPGALAGAEGIFCLVATQIDTGVKI